MNSKAWIDCLLAAYRVFGTSFPEGAAPENAVELASFRDALLSALHSEFPGLESELRTLDDQQWAAILVNLGICIERRVVPLYQFPIVDALYSRLAERREVEPLTGLPDGAKESTTPLCPRLFVCDSICRSSQILYSDAFLTRRANELAAFGVNNVETLASFFKELEIFPFKSSDGRFFAAREDSEERLAEETLHRRASALMKASAATGPAPPATFDKLLDKVYIPPELARRVLNSDSAPFQRKEHDSYAPLDAEGVPVVATLDVADEPRSFEPGAGDDAFRRPEREATLDSEPNQRLYQALLDAGVEGEKNGSRTLENDDSGADYRQPESIPYDRRLYDELLALPLHFPPDPSADSGIAAKDLAELGRAIDELFASGHMILYYAPLFKRHEEKLRAAGIESSRLETVLDYIRPQYKSYSGAYMQNCDARVDAWPLVEGELVAFWPEERRTTVKRLAERVYIPNEQIRVSIKKSRIMKELPTGEVVLHDSELRKVKEAGLDRMLAFDQRMKRKRIAFYSQLFVRTVIFCAFCGIKSPEELRSFIVEHMENVRDYGDYLIVGNPRGDKYDLIAAETLRLGYCEHLSEIKAFSRKRSDDLRIVDAELRRRPKNFKVSHVATKLDFPSDELISAMEAHDKYFYHEKKEHWRCLYPSGADYSIRNVDEIEEALNSETSFINMALSEAPSEESSEEDVASEAPADDEREEPTPESSEARADDGEVEASAEEEGFAESSVDAETEESEDESPRDAPQAPAPKVERPPELTTEERLAELVEGFATEGQTILYYRTMLERNDWLDEAYEDETALRGALQTLFPSFGFYETFCEPRRRDEKEPEEAKIRRSLILGWGSIDRTNLDKLKRQFCAPSTLIERTLKKYPDDFAAKGRSRFSLTAAGRAYAERLELLSSKLLDELGNLKDDADAFLFYEVYFRFNESSLAEMGIASPKELRRELANLNKEKELGLNFYREYCEYCEPEGVRTRYFERLRRQIHKNWGDSQRTTVELLGESIYAPLDDIRSALNSFLDFTHDGFGRYRRVRDVDGSPL
ncbi:MAG: hypothetical protein ACOX0A_09960 [Thermoguttaceae bacterium]|jgi:hypothetical protein